MTDLIGYASAFSDFFNISTHVIDDSCNVLGFETV